MPSALARSIASRQHAAPIAGGARRVSRHPDAAGQPREREVENIRHGTLCRMGAYDVRRRKRFGLVSEDHDSQTFVDLLDLVDHC